MTDSEISERAEWALYDEKQKAEPIPGMVQRSKTIDIAGDGCASIGTEVWTKGGEWRYCRDPHRCKAAESMARADNRSRELRQEAR